MKEFERNHILGQMIPRFLSSINQTIQKLITQREQWLNLQRMMKF